MKPEWYEYLNDLVNRQNRLLEIVANAPLQDIVSSHERMLSETARVVQLGAAGLTALGAQSWVEQCSALSALDGLDRRWSEIVQASPSFGLDPGCQLSAIAAQVRQLCEFEIPSIQIPDFAGVLVSQAVVESLDGFRQALVTGFEPTLTVFQTLQTTRQFSAFALNQMNRARERPAVAEASVAITAHLGSYLTAAHSSLKSLLIDRPADDESEQENEAAPAHTRVRRVNLFGVANRELAWVYRGQPGEQDYGRLVSKTRSARCSEFGTSICRVLYEINQLRQFAGKDKPFRLTTDRAFLAASQLPVSLADSEPSFADVVDRLYFLIYEASGETKYLRDEYSTQADQLLDLKYLRHYFRHDQERQKNWVTCIAPRLAGIFDRLVNSRLPGNPREWREAQLALYAWVLEVLLDICEQCRLSSENARID